MDPPSATDEDPNVKSEQKRERRFGQKDHVRMYGDDFQERLERAGFSVTTIDRASFPQKTVATHVIHPPVISNKPLATNRRRIYFAGKACPQTGS
jgi:hypothetical protein